MANPLLLIVAYDDSIFYLEKMNSSNILDRKIEIWELSQLVKIMIRYRDNYLITWDDNDEGI